MKNRGIAILLAAVILAAVPAIAPCAPPAQVAPVDTSTSLSDYQHKTLIVGIYEAPPFCSKMPDGQWTGLSVDLWNIITKKLNLHYEWREYQFEALLKAVANNDIDAAVGPISITADREIIMDFTHPYYVSDLAIAVPAKDAFYPWGEVASEFMTISWLKLIVVLVVMLAVSGLFVWWFERVHNHTQFGGPWRHGLGSAFWWAAVTMSGVGYGDKTPVTVGGRSVALIWMFISVITVALVTGSVTSAVVANRVVYRIHSPSDLGRAHVAVLNGSTAEQYALYTRIDYSLYPTLQEGLKSVMRHEVDACLANETQLRYIKQREFRGKLEVLPFTFQREDCSFALPIRSPLQEPLNRAILGEIQTDSWRALRARYLGN